MSSLLESAAFKEARGVADVTLFEGYVLYPYRASARKNQLRWQFGVLMPPGYARASGEAAVNRTECILEPRAEHPVLHVQVRFLQVQQRVVERVVPGPPGCVDAPQFVEVPELALADRLVVPFDEGVVREVDLALPLSRLADGLEHPFTVPLAESTEDLFDDRRAVGRVVRRSRALSGLLRLETETVPGPYGALLLRVRVENLSPYDESDPQDREEALRHALVAAHTLLGLTGGSFLSMLDPPEWARPAVARCVNEHTWPVLVGPGGSEDVVLSSPIILYDHPRLADESPGELYDATEIDEILTLRTLALTDEEKREARGTDALAAGVIDRIDSMPGEVLERLHGTVRSMRRVTENHAGDLPADPAPWWDPGADLTVSPETDAVVVDGTRLRRGSQVLLRPGRRRADAQDMFLDGRRATVEAVLLDVDDETYLAVTVDADPGADLQRSHGRFLYFRPDEVVPVVASR